jgi:hypothetical protein
MLKKIVLISFLICALSATSWAGVAKIVTAGVKSQCPASCFETGDTVCDDLDALPPCAPASTCGDDSSTNCWIEWEGSTGAGATGTSNNKAQGLTGTYSKMVTAATGAMNHYAVWNGTGFTPTGTAYEFAEFSIGTLTTTATTPYQMVGSSRFLALGNNGSSWCGLGVYKVGTHWEFAAMSSQGGNEYVNIPIPVFANAIYYAWIEEASGTCSVYVSTSPIKPATASASLTGPSAPAFQFIDLYAINDTTYGQVNNILFDNMRVRTSSPYGNAPQPTYLTGNPFPYPQTQIIDNFHRANSLTLGTPSSGAPAWGYLQLAGTGGSFGIQSDQVYNPYSGNYLEAYIPREYGPNEETYITFATVGTPVNNDDQCPITREVGYTKLSTDSSYQTCSDAANAFGYGEGIMTIWLNDNINNFLCWYPYSIQNGDTLGVRAYRNVIQSWLQPAATGVWQLICSAIDNHITSQGIVSFYGTGTWTNWRFADFGGGTMPLP